MSDNLRERLERVRRFLLVTDDYRGNEPAYTTGPSDIRAILATTEASERTEP